jgi:hypothetical protein
MKTHLWLVCAGTALALLASGCGVGKEDLEEPRKRRDAELKSMLIGSWVSVTHYKPGYKIRDGGLREVEVWTFTRCDVQ